MSASRLHDQSWCWAVVVPLLYHMVSSTDFNMSIFTSDFWGLCFGKFWSLMELVAVVLTSPPTGLGLYVRICSHGVYSAEPMSRDTNCIGCTLSHLWLYWVASWCTFGTLLVCLILSSTACFTNWVWHCLGSWGQPRRVYGAGCPFHSPLRSSGRWVDLSGAFIHTILTDWLCVLRGLPSCQMRTMSGRFPPTIVQVRCCHATGVSREKPPYANYGLSIHWTWCTSFSDLGPCSHAHMMHFPLCRMDAFLTLVAVLFNYTRPFFLKQILKVINNPSSRGACVHAYINALFTLLACLIKVHACSSGSCDKRQMTFTGRHKQICTTCGMGIKQ